MSLAPFLALAIAVPLCWALVPLGIRVAWTIGWLDHPEARKLHTAAMPVLGGAIVFVSAVIAWAITLARIPHAAADWQAWYLLAGAALMLVVGLIDDRFGMAPNLKMLGQAAAASLLIPAGLVPDLGLPIGIEAAITLVALIGLMNAVNFLDNMNGMVGGLSAILLAAFAWNSHQRGADGVAAAQLALSGACAGFLPHNFPKARIFLGDAGSLFLGYSLGASALLAMRGAPPGWGRSWRCEARPRVGGRPVRCSCSRTRPSTWCSWSSPASVTVARCPRAARTTPTTDLRVYCDVRSEPFC